MKVIMLGLVGLILGAIVGGVAEVVCGLVWSDVFQASSFEGYSGMPVFFTFMPIGTIIGALAGAVGLGGAVASCSPTSTAGERLNEPGRFVIVAARGAPGAAR